MIKLPFLLRLPHLLVIVGDPELLDARCVFFLLRNVSPVCLLGLCSMSVCVSISRQVFSRLDCPVEWAALASPFCSGDASIPMLCLSSTSEVTDADVASLLELYTEQKLVLFSTMVSGFKTVTGHCMAKRPNSTAVRGSSDCSSLCDEQVFL